MERKEKEKENVHGKKGEGEREYVVFCFVGVRSSKTVMFCFVGVRSSKTVMFCFVGVRPSTSRKEDK
jgi:3-mercaptopyruvate sulfurtransferase SseA